MRIRDKYLLFATFILLEFTSCYSSFVDELPKCEQVDKQCHKQMYEKVIENVVTTGIPEFGIPILDPYEAKFINVSINGLMEMVLSKGLISGIKDCKTHKFEIHFDEKMILLDFKCNRLVIEGEYIVSSSNILELLLQNKIRGGGLGKIVIENVRMKLDLPFVVIRKDDGEIYVEIKSENVKYTHEITGPVKFAGGNFYIGKQDISNLVINMLNNNWKDLFASFGNIFVDTALSIYFDTLKSFFHYVPVKHIITTDISKYIEN